MRIFLLFVIVLGVDSFRFISSDDLANLIVKYVNTQINPPELQLIKHVLQLSGPVWNSQRDEHRSFQCFVCSGGFTALFSIIRMNQIPDEVVIELVTELCTVAYFTRKVCHGFLQLNYPILKYIIETTPKARPNTFCSLLLQGFRNSSSCVIDDDRFEWSIDLPPKPTEIVNEFMDSKKPHLTIALISDSHIDPNYEPFGVADCDEPTCCRKGQTPRLHNFKPEIDNILNKHVIETQGEVIVDIEGLFKVKEVEFRTKITEHPIPAGYWGDYRNCDTPTWAHEDLIKRVASHKDLDFVYYVGDNIDHHSWETTYELNNYVNGFFVNTAKRIFRNNLTVIPAIGNHESQPINQFAPLYVKGKNMNTTWLYDYLATKWKVFLNDRETAAFRNRGEFSSLIKPKLRVISVNDNVAYRLNWWLVYDPIIAKRHLEWLVRELYLAELAGEKVHILSHIPPGDSDLMYTFTREYNRIINRFSSIISAQFTGHTHSDELKLFYNDNNDGCNVAWGVGCTTAYQNVNPNYKIVTLNEAYEPINMSTYIYNLTEANLFPYKRPRWFKLYDMLSTYQLKDLSPRSISILLNEMASNKRSLLDVYVAYSSKLSDVRPYCDETCKFEMLCNAKTTVLWDHKHCYL